MTLIPLVPLFRYVSHSSDRFNDLTLLLPEHISDGLPLPPPLPCTVLLSEFLCTTLMVAIALHRPLTDKPAPVERLFFFCENIVSGYMRQSEVLVAPCLSLLNLPLPLSSFKPSCNTAPCWQPSCLEPL